MTATRISSSSASAGALCVAALILVLSGHAHAEKWGGEHIKGSGVATTETRAATGFRNVALGVGANVEIRQGASEGLTITGDDNIVPLIETVVDSGTLKIRWASKGHYSTSYKGVAIVVNVRNIDSLSVSGSGDIHAAQLKTTDLRATIAGSGDISVGALDARSLSVQIAGDGDVTVAGRVEALDATISGSGDLDAAKLESRAVRITMHGSGDAAVWAKDTLNATIAGSGEITYSGKPQVTKTVAGSGSVNRAGDAS